MNVHLILSLLEVKDKCFYVKIASEMPVIGFNTMTYRSSEKVQGPEYFQRSVTNIKVQIMFK